jgi:hypothetical protein
LPIANCLQELFNNRGIHYSTTQGMYEALYLLHE